MDMGLKLKNRKVWYLFCQKSCHSHLFIVCIDFGGSHLCMLWMLIMVLTVDL